MNKIIFLFAAFAIFITGCASTGTVVVRTEPPGANVYFVDPTAGQNALLGATPLTFSKKDHASKSDVIQLRVEKDGFEPKYAAVAAFSGETTFVDMKLRTSAVAKGEIRDAFEAVRGLMSEVNRLVLGKRYAEALTRVEKALELDPKNSEAFAAKGSILFLMKDTEGAQVAWNKALELNPSFNSVRDSLLQMNLQNDPSRSPASTEVK